MFSLLCCQLFIIFTEAAFHIHGSLMIGIYIFKKWFITGYSPVITQSLVCDFSVFQITSEMVCMSFRMGNYIMLRFDR